MSRCERGGGTSSGAFVIMVPVLVLFIFGAIQVGLWYHARQSVIAAAQAGAEAASVAQAGPDAAQDAAQQVITQGAIHDADVATSATATTVTVTVSGDTPQMIPMGLHRVSATISLPKEHMS